MAGSWRCCCGFIFPGASSSSAPASVRARLKSASSQLRQWWRKRTEGMKPDNRGAHSGAAAKDEGVGAGGGRGLGRVTPHGESLAHRLAYLEMRWQTPCHQKRKKHHVTTIYTIACQCTLYWRRLGRSAARHHCCRAVASPLTPEPPRRRLHQTPRLSAQTTINARFTRKRFAVAGIGWPFRIRADC